MNKLFFFFMFFLCESSFAQSVPDLSGYTVIDVGLETIFDAALIVDQHQTATLSDNFNRGYCNVTNCTFYEGNRLLGNGAGHAKIRNYFIGYAVGHAAISYSLPRPWREVFQATTLDIETNVILHNNRHGLGFSFRL